MSDVELVAGVLFSAIDLKVGDEDEEIVELIASRMKPVIRGKKTPFEAVVRCIIVALQALAVLEDLDPEGKKRLILAAIYKAMDETKSPIDKFEEILKPIIAELIDSLLQADEGTLKFRKRPRRYLWKKWVCCGCAKLRRPPKVRSKPPASRGEPQGDFPDINSPRPSMDRPSSGKPFPELKPVADPTKADGNDEDGLTEDGQAKDDGKDELSDNGVAI